ncbi:hypothetical protein EVAR_100300_1 [Eumeta japonica]|uniref:Uncharacterized protein n=1 Tax=Eumeta variegata TaxID=151549 RepID=A0A4C1ZZL8_EUMVA|nr:hypothetical protein EVAR_100300_1 [Eumeta japonica]
MLCTSDAVVMPAGGGVREGIFTISNEPFDEAHSPSMGHRLAERCKHLQQTRDTKRFAAKRRERLERGGARAVRGRAPAALGRLRATRSLI